jgi:hypothetical protein
VRETLRDETSGLRCLLCGSPKLMVFYEIADVPASCNLLWTSSDAAKNCPKGSIKLAFCSNCSFIANYENEPEKNEYGSLYDNSLFYSGHFRNFAKELAINLIRRYNLNKKNIIEVGCGKVDFLTLFCKLGGNSGLRLNPMAIKGASENRSVPDSVGSAAQFQQELNQGFMIDFVFSYHELEHINSPHIFLNSLKQVSGINSKTQFFFAVPNVMKAFKNGDFTDIIYEHVSYFTIPSLRYLFSSCGFGIYDVSETKNEIFESIYIYAAPEKKAKPFTNPNSKLVNRDIKRCLQKFSITSDSVIRKLSQKITRLLNQRKRVVIWGAGARGVTILNVLKDPRIEYAVDLNPNKQGKYIPGTGQKIVSPDFLRNYKPAFVILANPSYRKEIERTIKSLGIKPRFILT